MRLWLKNLDHHSNNVARREELPLGALETGTDEDLEGIPDSITVRFAYRVVLQFTYDVGQVVRVDSMESVFEKTSP